ncbi:MAG: hypothetical protein M1492_07955 [Gammaproteobacteria bacterium]|nr:hypothetical protein [Gammaproteobacteria bacterium]
MKTAMTVRFEEERTVTGATQVALKQIADHMGVSQNKAVHMAINRMYDSLFPEKVNHDMPTPQELVDAGALSNQDPSALVMDDLCYLLKNR